MPKPEDKELVRGNAFIDGARILVQSGDSPEVTLQLEGSLPTPCHELRVDPQPADEQGRITIEVYSVVAPEMICAQVLQVFSASIPLPEVDPAQNMVIVNGQEVTIANVE